MIAWLQSGDRFSRNSSFRFQSQQPSPEHATLWFARTTLKRSDNDRLNPLVAGDGAKFEYPLASSPRGQQPAGPRPGCSLSQSVSPPSPLMMLGSFHRGLRPTPDAIMLTMAAARYEAVMSELGPNTSRIANIAAPSSVHHPREAIQRYHSCGNVPNRTHLTAQDHHLPLSENEVPRGDRAIPLHKSSTLDTGCQVGDDQGCSKHS